MDNQKIMKSFAVVDRILKLIQGCALAAVIVCFVFIPLTAILGEKIVADATVLNIGILKINLVGELGDYLDEASIKYSIIASLLGGMVVSAAAWYCLRVLRQVLEPMKEGKPFVSGISGKIRRLGWTILVSGIVADAAAAVSAFFELSGYSAVRLFDSSIVSSVDFSFETSLWYVAAAVFLFLLSYIFHYGELLQKEADETL